eukprot:1138964-Pelagomonas_calceolata.AAC.2
MVYHPQPQEKRGFMMACFLPFIIQTMLWDGLAGVTGTPCLPCPEHATCAGGIDPPRNLPGCLELHWKRDLLRMRTIDQCPTSPSTLGLILRL